MNLKETVIGIEFGSTRIKAVMLDRNHMPIAMGFHEWENRLINGVWTYTAEDIITGLQSCYGSLKKDVFEKFGEELTETGAIGVSAMMHGYLPFDKDWNQLTEFRTWRNTMTQEAAETLSELFDFNIPQRWCIAHLYQAVLNGEEHLPRLAHISTLAGYIHFLMTGKNVMGIGEASGVFPIDNETGDYDRKMMDDFDRLVAEEAYSWTLKDLLPAHVLAGEYAGKLTKEGALLLDPTGALKEGIPVAPCEGDAETGMTATNAVRPGTGNVSAGTSVFAMLVTDRNLARHMEVGMVATPSGSPVAMVHCSNCTSDINAWVNLLSEFSDAIGAPQNKGELYTMLFNKALEGDADCGGLLSYNYYSGEAILNLEEGRPMVIRKPDSNFNLANFMRMHLLSALATLKTGLDILINEEKVKIDRINGHGGFFTTPVVGQRLLSAAMGTPVTLMETAGEGGAYGMALLCAYLLWKEEGETLEDYLDKKVFGGAPQTTVMAEQEDIDGFNRFLKTYTAGHAVERLATQVIK